VGVKGGSRHALRRRGRIAIVAATPAIDAPGRAETIMTQTQNRIFDEFARLMNDAAGVASGVRREFDTLFRTQADRVLRDLDLVRREEFDAVKEMARLAREQNEALEARIAALEARLADNAWPPRTQPGAPEASPSGPAQPPTM
jgi:BMFP domain-containing protein YqiC